MKPFDARTWYSQDQTDPGDDEFTELFDADLGRIDLVGKGANGLPFLIAKSDAGAGIPAAQVHALIKETEMNVRKAQTDLQPFPGGPYEVESPSGKLMARYVDVSKAEDHARLINGVIRVRTPTTGSRSSARVAKAADSNEIAVYDAKGNLVGTVDIDKINQLADPPTKEADQPAPPNLQPAPASDAGVPAGTAMAKAQAAAGAVGDMLRERVQKAVTVQEREAAQKQLDGLAMAMLKTLQSHHRAQRR